MENEKLKQQRPKENQGEYDDIWSSGFDAKGSAAAPPPPLQLTAGPLDGGKGVGGTVGPSNDPAAEGGGLDEYHEVAHVAGLGTVSVGADILLKQESSKPVGQEGGPFFADHHLHYLRDIQIHTEDGRRISIRVEGRTSLQPGSKEPESLGAHGASQISMKVLVRRAGGEMGYAEFSSANEDENGSLRELIPNCAASGGFSEILLQPGPLGQEYLEAAIATADRVLPGIPRGWGSDDRVHEGSQASEPGERQAYESEGEAEFLDVQLHDEKMPGASNQKPWDQMTEAEKQSEAWKVFWKEFSWLEVVAGILAVLGVVALLAVVTNPQARLAILGTIAALAMADGLYSLLAPMLSGLNPPASAWLLNGLKVLMGIFIIAGLAMLGPEIAGIAAIGAMLTVVGIAIVNIVSAIMDFKEGVAAPSREAMEQSVKQSAHAAEHAVIDVATLGLAAAQKPLQGLVGKLKLPKQAGEAAGETKIEAENPVVEEFKVEPEAVEGKSGTPQPAAIPQMDATYMVQKGIIDQVRTGQIKLLNNKRKGNYGEMTTDVEMVDKGWTPEHQRITDIDAPNAHGIDHVFSKPGPPTITLVVDSKFGTSKLSTLANGTRQMSDRWIRDRLADEVGLEEAAEIVMNGYNALLAKVNADGKIVYKLLDSHGKVVGEFIP